MSEETDERAAWPREGEIWIPVLPWPMHECPGGLYVHEFAGPAGRGWMWGVRGEPFAAFGIGEAPAKAWSRPQAVGVTWELRYGAAAFEERLSEIRFGMQPVTVEVIGAASVWVHTAGGQRETLLVRDMLLGFRRVERVTLVEYDDDRNVARRTAVDAPCPSRPGVSIRSDLAAAVAPMLAIDMPADDPEAVEAAETLLRTGWMTFEGDPPISIEWEVA